MQCILCMYICIYIYILDTVVGMGDSTTNHSALHVTNFHQDKRKLPNVGDQHAYGWKSDELRWFASWCAENEETSGTNIREKTNGTLLSLVSRCHDVLPAKSVGLQFDFGGAACSATGSEVGEPQRRRAVGMGRSEASEEQNSHCELTREPLWLLTPQEKPVELGLFPGGTTPVASCSLTSTTPRFVSAYQRRARVVINIRRSYSAKSCLGNHTTARKWSCSSYLCILIVSPTLEYGTFAVIEFELPRHFALIQAPCFFQDNDVLSCLTVLVSSCTLKTLSTLHI